MSDFMNGKFTGQFDFDKPVTPPLLNILTSPTRRNCHWKLTQDCLHLIWDGCPSPDEYYEWLQLTLPLIKKCKYTLNGRVSYEFYNFITGLKSADTIIIIDNVMHDFLGDLIRNQKG